jgi:hypothetical protein
VADQPPISATGLIATAEGDRQGGMLDLPLAEYRDSVSNFRDSPQASDALHYIGSIHYSKQEWEAGRKSVRSAAPKLSRQQADAREPLLQVRLLREIGSLAGRQQYFEGTAQELPRQSSGEAGLDDQAPK